MSLDDDIKGQESEPEDEQVPEESGFDETYFSYAGLLRNWLGAYGAGSLAIVLSQEKLLANLVQAGTAYYIALCFILGVALQVGHVFLNKYSAWILYSGEKIPEIKTTRRYCLAMHYNYYIAIDIAFDLGSFLLFGRGTYLLLSSFSGMA